MRLKQDGQDRQDEQDSSALGRRQCLFWAGRSEHAMPRGNHQQHPLFLLAILSILAILLQTHTASNKREVGRQENPSFSWPSCLSWPSCFRHYERVTMSAARETSDANRTPSLSCSSCSSWPSCFRHAKPARCFYCAPFGECNGKCQGQFPQGCLETDSVNQTSSHAPHFRQTAVSHALVMKPFSCLLCSNCKNCGVTFKSRWAQGVISWRER